MIDLKGKNVLITGGSRGIGAACVQLFASANANVAFTFNKRSESANKLVRSFQKSIKIKSYKVDLLSEKQIIDCIEKVIKDFRRIDVLVNNAGIWKGAGVEKMTLKQWDETIKINLNGTFLFTKYVVPFMKKQRSGKIINITSTAGQRGEAFHSHYAASKGGVISFTKSLASELGNYNINVNSVAPGWVDTDMSADVLSVPSLRKKIVSDIPLKRIATAEDIAGPVLFLASDFARHITGEILNVNGGSVLVG
ncbi:MAG: 3-oxoacyl-ACP reductase FabG [Ignavibacteriaceae bacterium]|nr:3-oxoacyl-ACP reductase FabG [Ignavibacteriaceae bacterium]